jgi:carbamoylphosphate synthase large subunit
MRQGGIGSWVANQMEKLPEIAQDGMKKLYDHEGLCVL